MFVSYEFIPFISAHFLVARQMINEIAFFLAFKVRVDTKNYWNKINIWGGRKETGKG